MVDRGSFLLIPVKIKEKAERLSFYLEEEKVLEYHVFPVEEGETGHYYALLPVTSWIAGCGRCSNQVEGRGCSAGSVPVR